MEILGTIIFVVFLIINFFYTQRIYNSGKVLLMLFFFGIVSIPIAYFINIKEYEFMQKLNFLLLLFYYLLLLFIIKLTYKTIINFFCSYKLVDKKNVNKDFTYVLWVSDVGGAEEYWDENLAHKPIWVDEIITLLLIVIPILIVVMNHVFICSQPSLLALELVKQESHLFTFLQNNMVGNGSDLLLQK